MPTGVSGDKNSLQKLINFANEKNILLVNDNPYSFILNDNPTSIFNFEGSKKNCLELNSLSKSFNMAGWRVGMLLGSPKHIQNVLKVKSNMDSGMFYGIQKGAIEALNSSNDWFIELNKIYQMRRRLIWKLASQSGLFVWAKLPNGLKSEKFIDHLLYEKKIFVTPGTVFGSNGEGYIRFSLCANKNIINEAIERVK
jgi:aspartate/methionine/tyrosine aminotransferase